MARAPLLVAAATVGLIAAAALPLDVPPAPTRYLTDLAGVVSATRAAEIEQRLAAIEQRTGHQVIAAIFSSLDGDPLEDFTIRAAERWKAGRKGLDDGVIFFAFIDDRRMRLEVGYGLEDRITDALATRLLADTVRPAFRSGDYGGGVLALAGALESVFRGDPLPERKERRSGGGALGPLALIVLILLLQAASRRGRFRGRGGYWGGMGGFGGGFGGGGFGGGGFSGGGSFGGGGASGSW